MCGGKLEHHTVLKHPVKGVIRNIPNDVCAQCGEIFLSDESFDIVHSYGCKEKAAA
ncbi:YgiT-type zinc finger protein [Desulfonema limicola]|uniref:YgiT-type zinc finger protein n=1 Tax=Desulfonema limicola TaxID=45656 RepID=UPI003B82DCDE